MPIFIDWCIAKSFVIYPYNEYFSEIKQNNYWYVNYTGELQKCDTKSRKPDTNSTYCINMNSKESEMIVT